MNQYTGAPDQGGQRKREIKLGIEVLAIAHRLLDLIPFIGPTGNGLVLWRGPFPANPYSATLKANLGGKGPLLKMWLAMKAETVLPRVRTGISV